MFVWFVYLFESVTRTEDRLFSLSPADIFETKTQIRDIHHEINRGKLLVE